jgi:ribosomal protein L11 methyltransferase
LDELGTEFQTKAAIAQLEELDLQGKEVLDVGCGTGIISLLALRRGASKVICGDISEYMSSWLLEGSLETSHNIRHSLF